MDSLAYRCSLLGWILSISAFHVTMVRWCSLHQLNLGPLVWACGACLELLCKQDATSFTLLFIEL